MFKFSTLLSAVAGLAVAFPAYAADTTGSANPATETAPKAKEKMVCQRISEVGSRSVKKICQTEAQWRAEREQTQRDLGDRKQDN